MSGRGWRRLGRRGPAALFVALALVAAAAALAGRGSPRDASAHPRERGVRASRFDARTATTISSGEYRWLARTQGAPPSVAEENRMPGTRAWRLPGPARLVGGAAHGAIAGYAAEQAISPGQTQRIYVAAPGAGRVRIDVFRMGWYGGMGGRQVLASAELRAEQQPPCRHSLRTGVTECDWHPTLTFPIPTALASGVYIAKLSASSGAQSDCIFVVRARRAPALLVQIPPATYEAYNGWGGDSLYPGGHLRVAATGTTQAVEVSYDRPYETETGAGQFFMREVAIVRFLERYGYAAGYTTDASVDGDPAQLAHVRAVLDVGHSEYWSARQERAFARARDRGTSLLFLSSDTLGWRVRYARAGGGSSEPRALDHTIIAYKQWAALDPERREPTGLFPGGGAALTGSAYDGCITPRINAPGPPRYRYYEWRPAPALRPGWLFRGTGVIASTRIAGISGYELDGRESATPGRTRTIGSSTSARCMGADEPSPFRGSVADTTLYTARSGAIVFASGTLGWLYGLWPVAEASPDVPAAPDARVVAMTRNLLARALTARGRQR
jgi:hypothetical protein